MRWLLLVLLSSMVVMCGQKGPLELPESDARATQPASITALHKP